MFYGRLGFTLYSTDCADGVEEARKLKAKDIKRIIAAESTGIDEVPTSIFIQCVRKLMLSNILNSRFGDDHQTFVHVPNLKSFDAVKFMWHLDETKYTKSNNWYILRKNYDDRSSIQLSGKKFLNTEFLDPVEQLIDIRTISYNFLEAKLEKCFIPVLSATSSNEEISSIKYFIDRLCFMDDKFYFSLRSLSTNYSEKILCNSGFYENWMTNLDDYKMVNDIYKMDVYHNGILKYSGIDLRHIDLLFEICEYLYSEMLALNKIFGKPVFYSGHRYSRDGHLEISELDKLSIMEDSRMNMYCKKLSKITIDSRRASNPITHCDCRLDLGLF